MTFEALPARYGDCLLLTFPGPDRPLRLLVDGGPPGVFQASLKTRLEAERAAHPNENPLTLDAVMVSHIDEDHIHGILGLLDELQDAEQRRAPWPYRPRWLLHNSFDALAGEGDGGTARAVGGATVLAGLGGPAALPMSKQQGRPDVGAELVLASYAQGSRLASIAAALKISRNPPDQRVLMFDEERPRVLRIGEATLTLVGPLQKEVVDLQQKWAKWRAAQDKKKATADLAAYLDKSVPNLSSIVVLVELGGRRVLLTGDARGDKVLQGLTAAGLLTTKPLKVDVLKLPHHGSSRNLDHDFFESIHADHYVASGDGTHGNPDRDTLLMIEQARPDGGYTVHLTYEAKACDRTHEEWLKTKKKPFKPAKDAIADVVDGWRNKGKILVEEGSVSIPL